MSEIVINKDLNIYFMELPEEDYGFIKAIIERHMGGKDTDEPLIKKIKRYLKKEDISKIIAVGKTENTISKTLKAIIPKCNNAMAPRSSSGNSYTCYAVKETNVIMHEDVKSSWNCFLQTNGSPDYGIIYNKI